MSFFGQNAAAPKIAVAVLVGLAGIWAGARFHSTHTAAAPALTVRGPAGEASAPDPADAQADFDERPHPAAKIPDNLPAFTLSDRNGRATSVATWAGKSLVLNFWATWCAPCRREIPLLKSVSADWSRRGVEVVGIAVDYRDKVAAYADDMKIPYPILIGEQDALDLAAKLGVDSPVFPFTVFTDRQGRVVTLYIGELHKPQADLILLAVQNVNDHQVDLAEAQRTIATGLRRLSGDTARGDTTG
jgi:thiol-disulfide isomerase/thioredoxin